TASAARKVSCSASRAARRWLPRSKSRARSSREPWSCSSRTSEIVISPPTCGAAGRSGRYDGGHEAHGVAARTGPPLRHDAREVLPHLPQEAGEGAAHLSDDAQVRSGL